MACHNQLELGFWMRNPHRDTLLYEGPHSIGVWTFKKRLLKIIECDFPSRYIYYHFEVKEAQILTKENEGHHSLLQKTPLFST